MSKQYGLETKLGIMVTVALLLSGCGDGPGSGPSSTGDSDTFSHSDTQTSSHSESQSATSSDTETQTDIELKGCDSGFLTARVDGIEFSKPCDGASLKLLPYVRIGDTWHGGGSSGACSASGDTLSCPASDFGTVSVEVSQNTATMRFEAKADVSIGGLSLRGALNLPGATGWLSNGFQSWSMSGVIALGDKPTPAELDATLAETGETEVYRRGARISNWHTFAGGGQDSFFAGVTTAAVLRSYAQVHRDSGALYAALTSGAEERVTVPAGEEFTGEPWLVYLGEDLEGYQRIYGASLESRKFSSPIPTVAGWNSWYDLWDDVKQTDVLNDAGTANADLAAAALGPLVPPANKPLWIVVDDGWQKAWGDWEPNAKFSDGLEGMASRLHAMGLNMGVWLAPLLVAPGSNTAKTHPDWLVGGASYAHPVHGNVRVLDVTHPEAAAHLQDVIATTVEWGMGLLKIDFLFAGALEGTRTETVTGIEAYHRALELIRDAAGEEVILVAVGAPPIPSFPYVDGWRVGNDIAFKPVVVNLPQPTWSFIANQARMIASRFPYCLATACDADPPLLRVLPRNEVEAGLWVATSTGGAFFLSDDLRALASERLGWLEEDLLTLALTGTPAVPESFFPDVIPDVLKNMKDDLFSAEHQVPSVWRFQDKRRMAINFNNSQKTIEGVKVPAHTAVELP
ncbi:MAG: alpha-galactosidase [Myxococcota bacterium]|jgi:hypothetical protein|nr:alpha-galactosidase [Myxococcota bacterium]